jgi:hypothetical protein
MLLGELEVRIGPFFTRIVGKSGMQAGPRRK